MKTLLLIITIILIIPLENFFSSLGLFSLWVVVALALFNKIDWKINLPIFLISSLILDVTMHVGLGSHILFLGVTYGAYFIVNLFIPKDNIFLNSLTYLFPFLIFYTLMKYLLPFFSSGIFNSFELTDILPLLSRTVLSVIICMILENLIENFRDETDRTNFLRFKK